MPQLAAGRVYCSSMLDTLLYQVCTVRKVIFQVGGGGGVGKYHRIQKGKWLKICYEKLKLGKTIKSRISLLSLDPQEVLHD